ncbi:MAG: hypothetical protein COY81_01625 [Candidatus Pacebacteria bacterium CG_4_10_14_0_8_um_filter_43_12]|nr:MAG: hypothetical protein COY81_01625 [Candidatus Pacebacteria bacterium CG_4_10_14_0_8_um_filter_43_12]
MTNKLTKSLIAGGSYLSTLFTAAVVSAAASDIEPINPGQGWATDIGKLINSVLNIVMVVALLMVFLYLIMGGIQWITSGGDKGKTEEARNKITAAVIGIIILAAAYALVQFVAWILGFSDLSSAIKDVSRISS